MIQREAWYREASFEERFRRLEEEAFTQPPFFPRRDVVDRIWHLANRMGVLPPVTWELIKMTRDDIEPDVSYYSGVQSIKDERGFALLDSDVAPTEAEWMANPVKWEAKTPYSVVNLVRHMKREGHVEVPSPEGAPGGLTFMVPNKDVPTYRYYLTFEGLSRGDERVISEWMREDVY